MNSICARWSDRYLVATHWFIPAAVLNGPAAARSRAENVVNAALLAGTAGPFYALAYYLLGFPAAALEILLCCLCMLASPLLLRTSSSVRAARELFLCALFINFTWLSYHLGGIGAPTASWLITPPLVAMFLGGVTCALSWLVLSCVSAIALYALPGAGHALPGHPVSDMALLYLACHLGLFIVVLVFALLVQAGAMIRHCLRDCDTVARWSGDEFVALLEDLGGEGDARQVAEKILDRFGLPLSVAERECFITLSVGVAPYPAEDCDLDALLKRADIAMRSARAWGENSVQLYSSAGSAPRSERLALKNGLRDALARGQLFLEYQPQVDLATRRIVGVEALLRWQHPVYGRIDPGRFIPLAEETGMIVPIGDWVLRTACAQNRAWRDAGLPGVKTAVNLSARQLRVPKIAARVMEIVGATGLPCGCLELEITEGVLIDDLDANRKVLGELRAAGVLVSIDDFGTGYSGLNYLSELPVDILKMDGLFVRRLGASLRARPYAIAETIVAMAHRLELEVVAECVETAEQLADLDAMRCDMAQGYLFHRPLPAETIGALLACQASATAAAPVAA